MYFFFSVHNLGLICMHVLPPDEIPYCNSSNLPQSSVFAFHRWKMFSFSFSSWVFGWWPMAWPIRHSSFHMIPGLSGFSAECSTGHICTYLDKSIFMKWMVNIFYTITIFIMWSYSIFCHSILQWNTFF